MKPKQKIQGKDPPPNTRHLNLAQTQLNCTSHQNTMVSGKKGWVNGWKMLILVALGGGLVFLSVCHQNIKPMTKQERLRECALATTVVAATEGKILSNKVMAFTYVRSALYNQTLTLGPEKLRIDTYAVHPQCLEEGIIIIKVQCTLKQCTEVNSQHMMSVKEATQLIHGYKNLRSNRNLRSTPSNREKVLGWEDNLFLQWVKYSARQISQKACVTCYNSKRLPEVRPIPGIVRQTCSNATTCFAYCTTIMASWESWGSEGWTKNATVCPRRLNSEFESWTPPLTKVTQNLVHPFCVARGEIITKKLLALDKEVKHKIRNLTAEHLIAPAANISNLRDIASAKTKDGIYLKYRWLRRREPLLIQRRSSIQWPAYLPYWLFSTTSEAAIQCEQLIMDNQAILVITNDTVQFQFALPTLKNGTRPLADVFWICNDNQQVKVTLPRNWTGICAPVMLTGQLTVFSGRPYKQKTRIKRQIQTPWESDNSIYIAWNQEPIGVPDDRRAIGEEWIKSGQGTGWIPMVGPMINAQYIARNSRWVNFLWYNQQRFINWTVSMMEGISLQLHATTKMALQNRFAIDRLMAEENGVCSHFGDECCTVIPTVTGKDGNLTKLLDKLRSLRNEHVINSNWNTKSQTLSRIWEWVGSLSWRKILQMIGMLLGGFLLVVAVIMCCIIPIISAMIKKATVWIPRQFPLQVQEQIALRQISDMSENVYENETMTEYMMHPI